MIAAVAEHMISREDLEVEELVSSMLTMENRESTNQPGHSVSDYGIDEAEYEQLFVEIMTNGISLIGEAVEVASEQDHGMDISLG